jgi:hypothetical protein
MFHQRESLTFGIKPGDHVFSIHAGLDDFQRDTPPDGLLLFRHEYNTATAFADLLEQLITPDAISRLFSDPGRVTASRRDFGEESTSFQVCVQQFFNALTKDMIAATGLVQIDCPLVSGQLHRFRENGEKTIRIIAHATNGFNFSVIHKMADRELSARSHHQQTSLTNKLACNFKPGNDKMFSPS